MLNALNIYLSSRMNSFPRFKPWEAPPLVCHKRSLSKGIIYKWALNFQEIKIKNCG